MSTQPRARIQSSSTVPVLAFAEHSVLSRRNSAVVYGSSTFIDWFSAAQPARAALIANTASERQIDRMAWHCTVHSACNKARGPLFDSGLVVAVGWLMV